MCFSIVNTKIKVLNLDMTCLKILRVTCAPKKRFPAIEIYLPRGLKKIFI